MRTKSLINLVITMTVGTLAGVPAYASFHLMQIEQVIGGVNGDPSAQAIQLRMRSPFQNLVAQARIRSWDAQGMNPILLIDMTSNVASNVAGDRILIVSSNFGDFTTPPVSPDFTLTNLIPADRLAAGSITFEDDFGTIYWRLSWGGAAYMGPNDGVNINDDSFPAGDFGPAWPDALPSGNQNALLFQGPATALSTTNAADYALTPGAAVFTNNVGQTFTITAGAPIGACCNGLTGVCEDNADQTACLASGRRFGGVGSTCLTLNPPCTPSGACCDGSTGVCEDLVTQADCEGSGRRYGGDASNCATLDPPCVPPALGACCVELRGECLENIGETACMAEGGRYGGDGSTCATISPACTPVLTIGLELVAGSPAAAAGGTRLNSPLRVTHAGDGSGRLFIVDQTGQIRVVENGVLLPTPFLDITSKIVTLNAGFDERGLLGMAFHPDYATNGRFFVRYSADRVGTPGEPCCANVDCTAGCHKEVLAEFRQCIACPSDPNVADPNTEIILFEVNEPQFNHNAGQIAFGPDGMLYFSLGDGGGADDGLSDPALPHGPIGNGQNIDTPLGAILRIDVDSPPDMGLAYHIPADNPFASSAGADEIFAFGLRNPYSFSFDDGPGGDGALYVGDVGQALFEEIDIVQRGGNYGWVLREGAHCFDPADPTTPPVACPTVGTVLGDPLIDPVMEYIHPVSCVSDAGCAAFGVGCGSDGLCLNHGGISVITGSVYRGLKLPSLVGKLIFGDFNASAGGFAGRLYYFDTSGADALQRRAFNVTPAGVLDGLFIKGIGEDENGEAYVCVSANSGPFGGMGGVFRVSAPAPSAIGSGVRYISITLPDGPDPVAILVTPNCPAGIAKYVGTPGSPDNSATLVDDPLQRAFLTKAQWGGTVNVTGTDIVPSGSYKVQIDAGSPGSPALSGAATATTAKWGDAAGFFVAGAWTPPNGSNELSDVLAVIQAFASAPSAPPIFQADMQGAVAPCTPDRQIDIVDALDAIAGFQGFGYTESFPQCREPCP